MRLWTFFLAIPFTISFLVLARDRAIRTTMKTSGDDPVWQLDLRPLGYAAFALPHERQAFHFKADPICYSENDVLIASFFAREKVGTLARRDQTTELLPIRLHGIFLDARTGKVRANREWSASPPTAGIIAAGGGGFVVLTPAFVESYSADLRLLKEYRFTPDQQSRFWTFYISPTGRSILVAYNDCMPHCDALSLSQSEEPNTSFQWLDADSLQPQPAWSAWEPWSVSDNQLARLSGGYVRSQNVTIQRVMVRSRNGPWRTFCKVRVGYDDGTGCSIPEFISNDVLAMRDLHAVSLFPAEGGSPLLVERLLEDEWTGPRGLHASADGRRLAVAVYVHKGGSPLLDIDYHNVLKRIMVLDIPSRQWVYTLDATKQKVKTISGLALSPDGSEMAILTDGVVEAYRLPAEAAGPAILGKSE